MKRFTLGFMKSISSSSYEVELSDGSSSTLDAANLSQCTDRDSRSCRSSRNDNKSNGFGCFGNRDSYSWDESSSSREYDDSTNGSTVSEDLDEISNLPEKTVVTQITQRRTSSDLSVCTAASGRSISSSVSHFLTAVDSTVDVVVDALIPLDESYDSKPKQRSSSSREPAPCDSSDKLDKPARFKKALSLTKRISKINPPSLDTPHSRISKSKGIGETGDDQSTTSSLSVASLLKKKRNQAHEDKVNEGKNEHNDHSSLNSTCKRSFMGLIPKKNTKNADVTDAKTVNSDVEKTEQTFRQKQERKDKKEFPKDDKQTKRKPIRFIRKKKDKGDNSEGRDDVQTENEERNFFTNEAEIKDDETTVSVFDYFFKPIGQPERVVTQEFESDDEKKITKNKKRIFKRFRKKKNDNIQLLQKQKYQAFD